MSCSPELQRQHPGLPQYVMASEPLNACAKAFPRTRHKIKNGNRLWSRSITVWRVQSMAQRSYITQETALRPIWRDFVAVIDYGARAGQRVATKDEPVSLLAAIPAFNEQKTIGSVVLTALRYATKGIVIDDGSEDETASIAQQAGATVIRHPTNRGYGAALRSCFEYARESEFEVLVILDGDGQHRPEMIPQVAAPVDEGRADVSIGSRFLEGNKAGGVPGYRRFGIRVITKLTNLGTRHSGKITDAQSGFRAYSRAAIASLDPLETDMGASAEILWDADRKGLRIVEVPITIDYFSAGSTRGPVQHGLRVIGSMLVYVETKHALLTFGIPGVLLSSLGFGLGLYVVQSYSASRTLAVGLALVTLLFIFLGTLLLFTGLILHAVINAARRQR